MTTTEIKFEATTRPEGKNPRQTRAMGLLPVTVYGKGIESKSLVVNTHEFMVTKEAKTGAVCTLVIDKKDVKVEIQNVQVNYSTNEILNVEFKTV
ncbi:hypothetical protein IKA15_00980 [bacterium]|nr:hypothetical protein [bacterium]